MDKDALNKLMKLTDSWNNHEVRLEAVRSLARYSDDPDVAKKLAKLTDTWVTQDIRIAAIRALGGRSDADE